MPAKRLSLEIQCGFSIAGLGAVAFEHLAFMVDGAPQVMSYPVDLHENFIEMPATMLECSHGLHPISTDLGSKYSAEAVPPEANGLMCDVDAAIVELILDVAQGTRVPDIQHNRQTDNLRRRSEVSTRCGGVIA
jgi:hypothetical protein